MSRFFLVLVLVLTWAAIYLPGLGGMELKGEEGRRILPARVMMQTGDYVLPWSEGKPYHRKPPLINWSIAASFHALGGESEFAARLPSALAVLLLALTAAWAGRILAGPAGAWWLPLAILTTIGAVEKGRLAEIEARHGQTVAAIAAERAALDARRDKAAEAYEADRRAAQRALAKACASL